VIVREQQPVSFVYVVAEGRVKLIRVNPATGREVTLFLHSTGELFGVAGLIGGATHSITAVALDDVELILFPAEAFCEWIERFPAFAHGLLHYHSQRLVSLVETAADFSLFDASARVARLLARHMERTGGGHRLRLIQDLPQHELSSMIGSVREVVSRQLQKLRNEGVIEFQRGALRVRDAEQLLRRCETPEPD